LNRDRRAEREAASGGHHHIAWLSTTIARQQQQTGHQGAKRNQGQAQCCQLGHTSPEVTQE
jgi:hypothetical protein